VALCVCVSIPKNIVKRRKEQDEAIHRDFILEFFSRLVDLLVPQALLQSTPSSSEDVTVPKNLAPQSHEQFVVYDPKTIRLLHSK
jgi:hypothetical protein